MLYVCIIRVEYDRDSAYWENLHNNILCVVCRLSTLLDEIRIINEFYELIANI